MVASVLGEWIVRLGRLVSQSLKGEWVSLSVGRSTDQTDH